MSGGASLRIPSRTPQAEARLRLNPLLETPHELEPDLDGILFKTAPVDRMLDDEGSVLKEMAVNGPQKHSVANPARRTAAERKPGSKTVGTGDPTSNPGFTAKIHGDFSDPRRTIPHPGRTVLHAGLGDGRDLDHTERATPRPSLFWLVLEFFPGFSAEVRPQEDEFESGNPTPTAAEWSTTRHKRRRPPATPMKKGSYCNDVSRERRAIVLVAVYVVFVHHLFGRCTRISFLLRCGLKRHGTIWDRQHVGPENEMYFVVDLASTNLARPRRTLFTPSLSADFYLEECLSPTSIVGHVGAPWQG